MLLYYPQFQFYQTCFLSTAGSFHLSQTHHVGPKSKDFLSYLVNISIEFRNLTVVPVWGIIFFVPFFKVVWSGIAFSFIIATNTVTALVLFKSIDPNRVSLIVVVPFWFLFLAALTLIVAAPLFFLAGRLLYTICFLEFSSYV